MAILIHRSTLERKKSIVEEGITWRYRKKVNPIKDIECGTGVFTYTINFTLDKCKPNSYYPASLIDRNKCVFFTFEEDDDFTVDTTKELILKVDSKSLDINKLFVAPIVLVDLVMYGLMGRYTEQITHLIGEKYWSNCHTFNYYLKNKESIKKNFKDIWEVEYIPEVLYMGEIAPSCLKECIVKSYMSQMIASLRD